MNLSIVQGDFPNELKLAKVLPIYDVEEHFTQNYRPNLVLQYFSYLQSFDAVHAVTPQAVNSNDILYDKTI